MTNRRRLLQLAGSTFLLTENSVWAEPGDWAATLGTALDISPQMFRYAAHSSKTKLRSLLSCRLMRKSGR
jgi:hypothetical protein